MLEGIDPVNEDGGRQPSMFSEALTLDLEDIIRPLTPSPVSASQSATLIPSPPIPAADHSHTTQIANLLPDYYRTNSPEPLDYAQIKSMHVQLQQLGLTSSAPIPVPLVSGVTPKERILVDMVGDLSSSIKKCLISLQRFSDSFPRSTCIQILLN